MHVFQDHQIRFLSGPGTRDRDGHLFSLERYGSIHAGLGQRTHGRRDSLFIVDMELGRFPFLIDRDVRDSLYLLQAASVSRARDA